MRAQMGSLLWLRLAHVGIGFVFHKMPQWFSKAFRSRPMAQAAESGYCEKLTHSSA